jgi:hypothetical protein
MSLGERLPYWNGALTDHSARRVKLVVHFAFRHPSLPNPLLLDRQKSFAQAPGR